MGGHQESMCVACGHSAVSENCHRLVWQVGLEPRLPVHLHAEHSATAICPNLDSMLHYVTTKEDGNNKEE